MNQIFEKYGDVPPKLSNKYYKFIYDCCLKLSSYGTFNCLLSDSIHLFAFCSTKLSWITRKAPFGHAQLKDEDLKINFNEKNSEDDIMTVIATEPLTNNETWIKMERHEFHVFKNGISLIQFKDTTLR